MKRILIGAAVAAFGLASAFAWADCGVDHAAMASSGDKPAVAHAASTSKPATTASNKAASKHVKPAADKKTLASPTKSETTVVAKTN
jgi:hypothetical protein